MRTWRWWGVLRLALVLVWLVAATVTWWTTPRQQDYAQAQADLTAGRVTAYQWGDHWDVDRSRRWFGSATLESSGTLGPLFAWRTADGRVHWTDTSDFEEVHETGAVSATDYAGPGAVGLAQTIRAAGREGSNRDVDSPGPLLVAAGALLGLVFLGVVIAGPAPRLGTRWYWFWLVSTAPFGLGLLFWLFRDHPWTRSARPADPPGDRDRRDRGVLGLCIGMLASLVISILLFFLHGSLGDRWVPSPGS
ncbi:hypothetical protein AB0J80_19290 [Actinoplanes sp. NPDC049548]|uniref:hypothetical protein n=1 Tax=Actinoplanes sp. NPDC049548 TaxID=3155152 RepID=UPI0034225288